MVAIAQLFNTMLDYTILKKPEKERKKKKQGAVAAEGEIGEIVSTLFNKILVPESFFLIT